MKKLLIFAPAIAYFVALSSCHTIKGDGPSITKTYDLNNFSSVDAGIDGDVYYTQDSIYNVEIYGQSNILDLVETPIVDGELRLQFKKFSNVGRHNRLVVYISAPSLQGLGVNGSGNVYANQPIAATSVNLKVNGSGSVNINAVSATNLNATISGSGNIFVNGGSVVNEDLHISGSGDIDAGAVVAQYVHTKTSGSGNTRVHAENTLDVHISGSGDVYYSGNPSVNTSISGSGRLIHF